ncbi:MAG: extracellular solute-binding protein [Limnochordia bacterium]|jgi:ABC-type glycerol-3-phosphate transport system substrate-binding protein
MTIKQHRFIKAVIGLLIIAVTYPALAREQLTFANCFVSWVEGGFEQALDNFSQAHNVDIEIVDAPSWQALWEKVLVMSAAGVNLDVLYGDNATLMYFARESLSQPIDHLAQRDMKLELFPASVLSVLETDGRLYAIPTALSLHNLYYNVDLFAQAGLDRLPTGWESERLDWEEYASMVRKLTLDTDGDGQPNRFGTQTLGFGSIGFTMVGMWGVHLFNLAGTEWYGDTPEATAALESMAVLRTEFNAVGGSFVAGTAAIVPIQSYYLNTLAGRASLNWSVGPMPKGTQRSSQAGFHGISLATNTRDSELAWKLIKYLTYDPEGVVLFTRSENRVPVHPQAGRDFVQRWGNVLTPDEAWCIAGGVGYAYESRMTRPTRHIEIRQIMQDGGRRVWDGKVPVRQMMEEISPQIRALMQ